MLGLNCHGDRVMVSGSIRLWFYWSKAITLGNVHKNTVPYVPLLQDLSSAGISSWGYPPPTLPLTSHQISPPTWSHLCLQLVLSSNRSPYQFSRLSHWSYHLTTSASTKLHLLTSCHTSSCHLIFATTWSCPVTLPSTKSHCITNASTGSGQSASNTARSVHAGPIPTRSDWKTMIPL